MFTGLVEFLFEFLTVFFWSEFGTEFLCCWLFVSYVVSCPCPGVITCLELFKLAKDIFGLEKMVDYDLVSFLGSDECSNELTFFVLKELHLTYSSKNNKTCTFLSITLSICRFWISFWAILIHLIHQLQLEFQVNQLFSSFQQLLLMGQNLNLLLNQRLIISLSFRPLSWNDIKKLYNSQISFL